MCGNGAPYPGSICCTGLQCDGSHCIKPGSKTLVNGTNEVDNILEQIENKLEKIGNKLKSFSQRRNESIFQM